MQGCPLNVVPAAVKDVAWKDVSEQEERDPGRDKTPVVFEPERCLSKGSRRQDFGCFHIPRAAASVPQQLG